MIQAEELRFAYLDIFKDKCRMKFSDLRKTYNKIYSEL